MKALVFAAGLGTRLKPLTDTMPKALVPIAGKPLLEHVLLKLKAAGFDEVLVNVHHFADQVIDFLREKEDWGMRIEVSDERDLLLDTGGGIKKAAWFFDDGKPFLVHNVDILSNLDLAEFYAYAAKQNSVATLLTSRRETSRYLLFDDDKHLKGWINKATGAVKSPLSDFRPEHYLPFAFAGIHVLSPAILPLLDAYESDKFSIIDFYLSICDRHDIAHYPHDNLFLIDVGKLDSLEDAERFQLTTSN